MPDNTELGRAFQYVILLPFPRRKIWPEKQNIVTVTLGNDCRQCHKQDGKLENEEGKER